MLQRCNERAEAVTGVDRDENPKLPVGTWTCPTKRILTQPSETLHIAYFADEASQ